MAKKIANNVRLGLFVLSGLFILILLLYMIGKSQNMFGAKYTLKARFENVQGLVPGNNVRYGGIVAGTVKDVHIINDTTIEVVMLIKLAMKDFIRQDAVASIGTDGLMGNKLVNITPSGKPAPLAPNGGLISSKKPVDTDEMLRLLNSTNRDIAIIADNLKQTIERVNNSTSLWSVLDEPAISDNLKASLLNARRSTEQVSNTAADLQLLVRGVKEGRGSLGAILTDTTLSRNLNEAILKIESVGVHADSLSEQIGVLVTGIHQDVNQGKGVAHAVLKDSTMVHKLNNSLRNIEQGTAAFNENMEALKSNFLFRGYFRKVEKRKAGKSDKLAGKDTNQNLSNAN